MVREYTPIIDGFQIRDIVTLSNFASNTYPENPTRFDIVKWVECEPYKAIDLKTGEEVVKTKHCYSVGTLEWDKEEPCFEFKSIGLRWLEENPSEKIVKMILGFCKMMENVFEED